mmetsp:Transcript_59582/g.167844  ORF Transcript_59582/g.167844 Transcript_59582/m.167844 type:complete len:222 (-) Transcript_59582:27-692(-)
MDDALQGRLRELVAAEPTAGYRVFHARLKEEPEFQQVSLKKVQTALQQIRTEAGPAAAAAAPAPGGAPPGENIWTAAGDGDIPRVEELMVLENLTPTSPDENGYTPVHAAASWGRVDLLRLLLARDMGAANVVDSDGDTPLHHVATASELDESDMKNVMELLLAARADPGLRNNEQKTCLDLCTRIDNMDEEGEEGEGSDEDVNVNLEFVKVLTEHGTYGP